jgi:hypothetical protein
MLKRGVLFEVRTGLLNYSEELRLQRVNANNPLINCVNSCNPLIDMELVFLGTVNTHN